MPLILTVIIYILIMKKYKNSIAHFIELRNRYAIDARLLGRSIKISVPEFGYMRVILPSLVLKKDLFELKIPRALEKYDSDLDNWGSVKSFTSSGDLDIMNVWISAFIVECYSDDSNSLPNSDLMQDKVRKVIHALQIINPDAIRSLSDDCSDDLCDVTMSVFKPEVGESQIESFFMSNMDTRKEKLSIADIRIALQNANNTVSIPYEMLNNARINFENRDTRATVLNCATAIEVMLKRKILVYFDENNTLQSLRDYLLKRANSYDTLINLCKALSINIKPISIINETVMKIRDRAIHGGYIPSNEESRKAYEETRKALKVMKEPMFDL